MGWLVFLPAIVGVLLAAPLVLELDQRTYRLAWTQGITRTRWFASMVIGALAAALAFGVVFALLCRWWYAPQNRVQDALSHGFDHTGFMPFAYAVFALALALAVGALSRRIVPSILAGLAGFFVARLSIGEGLRDHYLEPLVQTAPVNPDPEAGVTLLSIREHAWILRDDWVDKAGNTVNALPEFPDKQAALQWIQSHGLTEHIVYQPADRFWVFQGIEAGIYLGMAALLLALAYWVVTRRLR
jgi:hypothetical protein